VDELLSKNGSFLFLKWAELERSLGQILEKEQKTAKNIQ